MDCISLSKIMSSHLFRKVEQELYKKEDCIFFALKIVEPQVFIVSNSTREKIMQWKKNSTREKRWKKIALEKKKTQKFVFQNFPIKMRLFFSVP